MTAFLMTWVERLPKTPSREQKLWGLQRQVGAPRASVLKMTLSRGSPKSIRKHRFTLRLLTVNKLVTK